MSPGRVFLFTTTAALLGLSAYSFWAGPILSVLSLGFLMGLYLAFLGIAALYPELEVFGPFVARGPLGAPLVALTFDDGPDPASTPQVLDALAAAGSKATFFVVGERAAAHPELLQRMAAEGHSIGVHSYDHYRGYAFLTPAQVAADIERCREIVRSAGVLPSQWFRSPVGQVSPRTFAGMKRVGALFAGWSVRPRDGIAKTTEDDVFERVAQGLEPGAIVLLHDAWERPRGQLPWAPAGARALPRILEELGRRGLRSVPLDELFGTTPVSPLSSVARAASS